MSNTNQNITNECTEDVGPATLPGHSQSIVNSKRSTKTPHPLHKPKLLLQYAQEKGWSEAKIQQWERRLIKRKQMKAAKRLEKKKMNEQMSAENAIVNSGPSTNTTLPVRGPRSKLKYAREQKRARIAEKRLIYKTLDQMCAAELPECTPQERNRLEAKIAEILKITVKRRDRKAERGLIDETPDQMCDAKWSDSTPSSQTTNGNTPCENIPPTENKDMDQPPILNSSQLTSDHTTTLYRQDRVTRQLQYKNAHKIFPFINMAIIKEDFPVDLLSYEEGETIKKTIINLIDDLDEGAQLPRIRFAARKKDDYTLYFRCDDSYTVDWLISTFDENENVLLGTRLCVAKVDDLYNVIVSFTTKDLHTTKASVLLEQIQKCNPQLLSSRWEALYSVIQGKFRVWVFEVSRKSSIAIRNAGCKADSGVHRGVFKFLSVEEESALRTASRAAVL